MSKRDPIVLVDDDGDELFARERVPSGPLFGDDETCPPTEDEPIPETLRSSELLRELEPASRPIIIDEVEPPKGTGNRAA